MILTPTPTPSIDALLYHAEKEGILPITSVCNMNCVFCSNKYNPKGCEVLSIPPRSLREIEETILWLGSTRGPIVIGESVTRINEGEPLTHPEFLEIIKVVRRAYPYRTISVTTNATLLTEDLIEEISEIGNVEFVVSLNTVGYRKEVMGDIEPEKTLRNVALLGSKIPFEGSIVALPFLTGWQDITETAVFLKESGATTIRLLAPGFSKFHPLSSKVSATLWDDLFALSIELTRKMKTPVLFEPPRLKDLVPEVMDVLPRSPARKAGLRSQDVITMVRGDEVFSRTHAFTTLRELENPKLTYERDGVFYDTVLYKEKYVPPGLIMYDDLAPEDWFEWERKARVRRRKALILTSRLAKPLIESALVKRGLSARVEAVPSLFFGGNIQAAGLLTVRDFLSVYEDVASSGFVPDVITLPKRAFDPWGRDLEGVRYKEIEMITGRPVVLG